MLPVASKALHDCLDGFGEVAPIFCFSVGH